MHLGGNTVAESAADKIFRIEFCLVTFLMLIAVDGYGQRTAADPRSRPMSSATGLPSARISAGAARQTTLDVSANSELGRGILAEQKGAYSEAVKWLNRAVEHAQREHERVTALLYRGSAYAALADQRSALSDAAEAVRYSKEYPEAYNGVGWIYIRLGRYGDAISVFQKGLAVNKNSSELLNSIAWFRATCPLPAYRNGAQAASLALAACRMVNWTDPDYIDTLAAAYAENGDYPQAIKYANQALSFREIDTAARSKFQARLALYSAQKCFRQLRDN